MAKGNKYNISESKKQQWIKEGRGAGEGKDYKPWITVRDVPSEGRSHRVFGHKTQRTHHLLSDLELAVFLLLDWNIETIDIREQFPLRQEDTLALAFEAGIEHPALNGVMHIMSSDFLVNTSNTNLPKFVLQAKYTQAIQDPRTIEKLELERRYWQLKGVPWQLVTEQDIPKIVFQNISWLYPAQRDELSDEVIIDRQKFYSHQFQQHPNKTIIEIAKKLDVEYNLAVGESLLEIRQLLARRCFIFDILTPINKLKAANIKAGEMGTILEVLNVSYQ
ncbi:TnsA endonuclease C-terminal domain-containing protein [Citrobacter portucalensis]|uniref:TnsA endonuclease C-terminal domain-containing protein n=1 Tax=Citrobacter portucalensis TaxID=1639133 RepID=UPI001F14980B|nr:TnsA endonuclease C-terminal domain-containing protein [Citrobacter portucalensis]